MVLRKSNITFVLNNGTKKIVIQDLLTDINKFIKKFIRPTDKYNIRDGFCPCGKR